MNTAASPILDPSRLVVHCSATRPSHDIGALTIDEWHRERGWSGIGYHFVIRRDGRLELGRPLRRIGAHVRGHNRDTLAVCLVGGLDEDGKEAPEYTDAQLVMLHNLCEWVSLPVVGHHDLAAGKACPCFDVARWRETGEVVPRLERAA